MAPNYLARSGLAWTGIALILTGFALKFVTGFMDLPLWVVPVGYFTALAGAGVLFVGWVAWRAR